MRNMFLTGTALLLLASGSAMAADLSRPPPAAPVYTKAPPAPLFTWTGCYVGGNGGGIFTHTSVTDVASGFSDGSLDFSGAIGGGQVGCNYQFSSWVVGIQGDYDWSGSSGSFIDLLRAGVTNTDKVKSLASVTGRLGYAWDRFMLYAKGGGAWESHDYSTSFGGVTFATTSDTRSGWTAGGGGEYAFYDWLTGFVEADYYDFGSKTELLFGPTTLGASVKETAVVAKAGLNIKFGGWH